jgi:hypothetical protein
MADNGLQKLTISSHSDTKRSDDNMINEFSVMFNPTTLNKKHEIEYYRDDDPKSRTFTAGKVFGGVKLQEYDFEFLLDGTGVSNAAAEFQTAQGKKKEEQPTRTTGVEESIDKFLQVCGRLDGDLHRPPYLQIKWGHFVLDVVLKLADITYTLFDRTGIPLRAKITATFDQNVDDEIKEADEGKNSPDLSHLRTVLEGDHISLMTNRVYGKSESLYIEVARFNRVNNFRRMQPGRQLVFPPIDKTTL